MPRGHRHLVSPLDQSTHQEGRQKVERDGDDFDGEWKGEGGNQQKKI